MKDSLYETIGLISLLIIVVSMGTLVGEIQQAFSREDYVTAGLFLLGEFLSLWFCVWFFKRMYLKD